MGRCCQYRQKSTLGLFFRDKADDRPELLSVAHAEMAVAPSSLRGVAHKVDARDMATATDLSAAQPVEKVLSAIRARTVFATSLLAIDALHGV